jgi:hypothetical protein
MILASNERSASSGQADVAASGRCDVQMTFLILIAVANFVTTVITVAAAIRRPIGGYIFIAAIALCAFLSSLYQIVTETGTFISSILTIVLVALIIGRIFLNTRGVPPERPR